MLSDMLLNHKINTENLNAVSSKQTFRNNSSNQRDINSVLPSLLSQIAAVRSQSIQQLERDSTLYTLPTFFTSVICFFNFFFLKFFQNLFNFWSKPYFAATFVVFSLTVVRFRRAVIRTQILVFQHEVCLWNKTNWFFNNYICTRRSYNQCWSFY